MSSTTALLNVKPIKEIKIRTLVFIILGCFLLLYLPFLSQHIVGDDVGDLMKIQHGPSDEFFIPRHMVHLPLGYGFYSLWTALGYSGGPFVPMAVISALSGAIGVALLFQILYKISGDRVASLIICLLAGVSYGYWYHSTTMRVSYNIIAVVPNAVSILLLLKVWEKEDLHSKFRYAGWLALSLSLAIVVYQASILIVPAIVVGLFLDKHLISFRDRVKLIVLFSVLLGIFTGLPYLIVGIFIKGLRTPGEFVVWWSTYHTRLPMWSTWSLSRIPSMAVTLVGYIMPLNEGLRLRDLAQGIIHPDRLIPQFTLGLVIVSFAVAGGYVVYAWRRLWQNHRAPVAVSSLLLVGSLIFFTWFDPFEMQYWMVQFIPAWILLTLALSDARQTFARYSPALTGWSLVILAAVAFSTFSLSIFPRRFTPDPLAEKARLVKGHMEPVDILITAAWDWSDLVPYVAQRQRVSVLTISARVEADPEEGIRVLEEEMAQTWARGGRVYLVDVFSYPPATWEFVTINTNLTVADFDKYEREEAWVNKDEIIWEIIPPE